MQGIRKRLVLFMLLGIVALSLVGCFRREVVVATINNEEVSEQIYYINLWSNLRGLEAIFQNFWNAENLLGKSPEEFLKTKALESVARCIIVEQKAEELGRQLTKEEKTKIKESAKKSMEENAEFAKAHDIRTKDYESYYTYAVLSEKVNEALAESYEPNDTEISGALEEIKANGEYMDQATIIHVLIATQNELGQSIPSDKKEEAYEKAQEVLKKALAGEDMSLLATMYSDDDSVEQNSGKYTDIVRGNGLGDAIDQVVFEKATVGEVYPEIVETDYGYEIIKVLEVDKETEEELKERATMLVKSEYAKKEIDDMVTFATIETTEAYDNIRVNKLTEDNVS